MKDYSDIPHTCGKIDEVISAIQSVNWEEDSWHTEKDLVNLMEEIRSANAGLREWGNNIYRENEENEETIDDLKDKIKDLEYYIDELVAQVRELEL